VNRNGVPFRKAIINHEGRTEDFEENEMKPGNAR